MESEISLLQKNPSDSILNNTGIVNNGNVFVAVKVSSSALKATRIGIFDWTKYSIFKSNFSREDRSFLRIRFSQNASPKLWFPGIHIIIEGIGKAVITYKADGKVVNIVVKPIGYFDFQNLNGTSSGSFLIHQIVKKEVPQCLQLGLFDEMEDGTNGRKVIKSLFGGLAIGVNGECTERRAYDKFRYVKE